MWDTQIFEKKYVSLHSNYKERARVDASFNEIDKQNKQYSR